MCRISIYRKKRKNISYVYLLIMFFKERKKCMSINLSFFLSLNLSFFLSIFLSFFPSFILSVYLSFFLSLFLTYFIYFFVSFFLSIFQSFFFFNLSFFQFFFLFKNEGNCHTRDNIQGETRQIRCSACKCGHNDGDCRVCPNSKCHIHREQKFVDCDQCPYGHGVYMDTRVCTNECRGIIGDRLKREDCRKCPRGSLGESHKGYCKPCGCKCRSNYYQREDIYVCNPCGCKCGVCVRNTLRHCCACNCKCDVCWEGPGLTDLRSSTGIAGASCCACNGGSGGCFPSVASVSLENGKSVTMAELQVGDKVQTGRPMLYCYI